MDNNTKVSYNESTMFMVNMKMAEFIHPILPVLTRPVTLGEALAHPSVFGKINLDLYDWSQPTKVAMQSM